MRILTRTIRNGSVKDCSKTDSGKFTVSQSIADISLDVMEPV